MSPLCPDGARPRNHNPLFVGALSFRTGVEVVPEMLVKQPLATLTQPLPLQPFEKAVPELVNNLGG